MLAADQPGTKIVFLAIQQPYRPYVRLTRSSGCIWGLPPHVLLCSDAAYAEYVRRKRYEAASSSSPPARTWSCAARFRKFMGLGAPPGWLYGPAHVVDAITASAAVQRQSAAMAAGIAALRGRRTCGGVFAHTMKSGWLGSRPKSASSGWR